MLDLVNYFVIVVVCCTVNGVLAQLYDGDSCTTNDGTRATCKYLTKCQSALNDIRKGIYPSDICGFVGTKPIVCCTDPNSSTITKTTTSSTTTRTTTTTRKSTSADMKVGVRASEKCQEYAKFSYEESEDGKLIIGGTKVIVIKEFPHMALIGYQAEPEEPILWNCGGSIISDNFVLTAAHCFYHHSFGYAKFVRVGITDRSDTSHMQHLEIEKRIYYPKYTGDHYHDIGLLKLASKVRMNPYATAACLFTEKVIPNVLPIATGWGIMEETGNLTENLMKVTLEIFPHDDCAESYKKFKNDPFSELNKGIVDDWMICAGSTTMIKDTCRGDSGGPLQIDSISSSSIKDLIGLYNIIGVTSFGKPCGFASKQPGVYTRISYYVQWIEDVVWPDD
ncbi:venom protease isoform X1 [Leptinotarsa decemlineata]|uniref:venom protease isoform X1 n=1 Tax=Leptinotarsa decemlineata TaxID=7539 RepID=UPI003D30A8D4